jgi:hypothetical protein
VAVQRLGESSLVLGIPIEHGNAAGSAAHEANTRRGRKLGCNLAATNKTKSASIAHHRLFANPVALADKFDGNGGNSVGRIIGLPISKIICFHLNALQKMLFLPAGAWPASCAICLDRFVGRDIEMLRPSSLPVAPSG